MLDVTIPLEKIFVENEDKPLADVLKLGRETARNAVEYTKELQARRGRASYLGARSVGHIDPGAAFRRRSYIAKSLCTSKKFF